MDKHQACSRLISALGCVSAVLIVSLLAASPRPAGAQSVVVMVNGDPITARDIDQRAKFNQLVSHKPSPRDDVIEELINEKLKIQVGRRYKLEIGDGDVDASYAEMGKRMSLSPEQLSQTLEKAGVDPATLKSRIRADMVWHNVVRGKFQSSFQFRDKDILAALESRKKDDKDNSAAEKVSAQEYLLRPILFIVPKGAPQAKIDARRAEAEALRSRFEGCDRGLAFARALKDVAVRDQITRSSADLAPALREILDRTGEGRLTSPETTPNGIELFAICGKREVKADAPALRQVRQEMMNEQFEAKSKRFLSELRRQALIEKK